MNDQKTVDTELTHTALPQYSPAPILNALSERYASRGIVKAVEQDVAAQCEREEQIRELAPEAYRLSLLSEEAVKVRYCHGENEGMTANDLLSYFDETRAMRLQDADFAEMSLSDETETDEENTEEQTALTEVKEFLPTKVSGIVAHIKQKFPKWFDSRVADTSAEKKTFPLSAFAAVAAVAASLMLIVASSVMVTLAESRVSSLEAQIDTVSVEIADLDADLNVQHDLMQIREIAVREYGMVSEEYVRMDHVSLQREESVENYREEKEETVRLGALLSAIGAHKYD